MIRQADTVERIIDWLPLHYMEAVDLIAIQAVPNVFTTQHCLGPIVSFAFHFFSISVFPVSPVNFFIRGNIFAENHH